MFREGQTITWWEHIDWRGNTPKIVKKPIKYTGIIKKDLMNGWQVISKYGKFNLRDII